MDRRPPFERQNDAKSCSTHGGRRPIHDVTAKSRNFAAGWTLSTRVHQSRGSRIPGWSDDDNYRVKVKTGVDADYFTCWAKGQQGEKG